MPGLCWCGSSLSGSASRTLIAGGECLDDVALLRADSAQALLRGHGLPEPTTLGRFLRRFSLGHLASSTGRSTRSSRVCIRCSIGRR